MGWGGVSSPAFRKKRGVQGALLASALFQVPLAQNNPYAKVGYLGWHSAILQSAKSLRDSLLGV